MSFDVSDEALAHHVRVSIEARKAFINETYEEMVRRFCGPAFREDAFHPNTTDYENHAHSWLSNFLPMLASGNPRIKARSPRMHSFAAAFAKATELGVNRNFQLTDIKRTIEQLATDWAFRYCVALTTPVPMPGLKEREDPVHRPTTRRLALADYIWDTLAQQHAECRFQAHKVVRDKEDILEEGSKMGWDVKAVMGLHEDDAREMQRKKAPMQPSRGEVAYWEVLVHEHQLDKGIDQRGKSFKPRPEKGFNGTVFTVSEHGGPQLRDPRPFFGPRVGPYTFGSYLYVPDEVVGLAPLIATAAQTEELNAVMAAVIEGIRRYKRGIAVSSDASGIEEKLANFMDLGVFTVDSINDLANAVMPIEAGGLSNQHFAFVQLLRNLSERSSGITEAIQGQVSGDATATEASIAQMASGRRAGYMAEKFSNTVVTEIAKKEAFYLTMDPRSRTPLPDGGGLFLDPETGAPIEYPVMVGTTEHLSMLEDIDVEIQAISMRYTSEMLEAEREMQWTAYITSVLPLIPQMPYFDWAGEIARKAEMLGDPSRANAVNVEKAMALGAMQTAAGMGMLPNQQPPPSLSKSQPRLGIDLKTTTPTLKSSEKPSGFSANARPNGNAAAQARKGPRMAGETSSTR